jgi:DNA polymerase-3 subunit alpha
VEGISRHASTHAAGVVISKEALTRHVPLQRASRGSDDSTATAQFSMDDIARIGLLKLDILGLANLTILGKARDVIRESRGEEIDLFGLPMDDARTYEMLAAGDTFGVFQLEGSGMRRYLKDLGPTAFSDVAAMVALYRPGPMEQVPRFIRARHGEEKVRYPHPAFAEFLEETYGVIVYQDQVLFIVRAFSGYTLGQADIFRKAMGKKIPEVMQKEKQSFLEGAVSNGFGADLAEEVFALIEPFAGYAFNKAHAVSYALIAYQTAYLKANYPAEYLSALMTVQAGQSERVGQAVGECQRLSIGVLQPDVNSSRPEFSIEPDGDGNAAVRFGLAAIKHVGIGAIESIVAEREKAGPHKSVEELCRRCDLRSVNKRVMESLIRAGAFDSLGPSRGAMLGSVDRILSLAQREQRLRESGQTTMFDLWGEAAPAPLANLEIDGFEVSDREKASWEKELLGVSLSVRPFVPQGDTTLCGQVSAEMSGQVVTVAGRVASVRYLTTKAGKPFASVALSDLSGRLEVMVWPNVYAEAQDLLLEDAELLVEGKVRVRNDEVGLACDKVRVYEPGESRTQPDAEPEAPPDAVPVAAAVASPAVLAATPPRPAPAEATTPATRQRPRAAGRARNRVVVVLRQTSDRDGDISRLREVMAILREFPGEDEVSLRIANNGNTTAFDVPSVFTAYCDQLRERLVALVGEQGLTLEKVGSPQGGSS